MYLMDQPLIILAAGVAVVGSLVVGLLQTGNRKLLYAAITATVLASALLALERVTLTPEEQIAATLNVIANDLKNNPTATVLEHISSGRPQVRQRAERQLSVVEEVLEVDIKRNLKVEVANQRGTEVAVARFNAVVRLRTKGGFTTDRRPVPRYFTVHFRREEGKWRVRDYEMADPRAGMGLGQHR